MSRGGGRGAAPSSAAGSATLARPAAVRVAVAALSAAGLTLEIALTRLASLLYFSPFVYVLLSVAVLGLGLGAAVATAWRSSRTAAGAALAAVVAALLAPLLLVALEALAATRAGGAALGLVALPFAALGHALATVFAGRSEEAPGLYLVDLVGAGIGALGAVGLLGLAGAPATILAAGVLAGIAGLLLAPAALRGAAAVGAAVAAAALLGALTAGWPAAPLARLHAPKPLTRELAAGAQPIAHRWTALGRTDAIRAANGARYLFLDGGAGSLLPDVSDPGAWLHDVGAFPFAAMRPTSAFVIGPGGGLDLALARHLGTQDITAVELNGAAVRLAASLGPGGDPYRGADVRIDEGRSALRRARGRYDLVFLSQVVTDAAEARSYALVENTLYTVEAFSDDLDHLTPGGAVALKLYDELTLTRALTTAVTALSARGMTQADAGRHLLVVLDARPARPVPLLMVFDHALEPTEGLRLARLARALDLQPLFVPGVVVAPPLDGLLAGRTTVADLVAASPDADISPTRDARPFFFEVAPGLPHRLRALALALALAAIAVAAVLPLRQRRRAGAARAAPALFALLGLGFMLLEVGVLQRLRLYLGHPTISLSVALAALLIGAGLGAGGAGRALRAGGSPLRAAAAACAAVIALAALGAAAWPPLAHATMAASTGLRAVVAAAAAALVAVPMGAPFPLALRAVGRHGEREVALAWAVNGLGSVAGGVGATCLAVVWGYPVVWAGGAAVYGAAAGVALLMAGAEARAAGRGATVPGTVAPARGA